MNSKSTICSSNERGKEILPAWWEVDYYIVIFMIDDEDKIQDLV